MSHPLADRFGAQPHAFRHRLPGETVRAQDEYLLVAISTLHIMGRSGACGLLGVARLPAGGCGQGWLGLLWQDHALLSPTNLRSTASQQEGEHLDQVANQVETVCDLHGLRGCLRGRFGILARTITRDELHAGMGCQPARKAVSRALGQEIGDTGALLINDQRAIALAPLPWSGKGNGVAAIPSPKNRTGRFLYIRLKPFSPPVSPDAVSPRVNPGYGFVDDR